MGRVQTARHDGLLRRLFSIKGEGSLLPETLGDLFPTLDVESVPIELLRLSGWELGIGGLTVTAAVGTTGGVQIFNPAGSGKIVVPTKCLYVSNTSDGVFLGVTDVALLSAVVGRQRDTREGVTARTSALIREGDNATPPVGAAQFRTVSNTQQQFEDPNGLAVLAPGTGLTFVSIATNPTIRFGVFWRERTAEPSELSF